MPPHTFNIGQTLNEALGLHRQGRLRDAEKLYARVLKAAPDNFDALHLLGLVKAQGGQMGEAFRLMSAAVKINPLAPDAWVNLANVLQALKRPADALGATDRALALAPGDETALTQRGNALLVLGRAQQAFDSFDKALARNARNGEARFSRGVATAALGRPADALADFDAVLAMAPTHAEALYNRGNALLDLGRFDEAIAAFDKVIARAPQHIKALNNRGRALQALNRHADAVATLTQAVAADKTYADAHFNLALSLLSTGDLPRGFAAYEWRWRRTGMEGPPKYGKPLWLGEYPLGARTILLHAEQGLGDTIQFARYVPMLARGGARVVLQVQPELQALLAPLDGVTSCLARGEPLPPYDVHCPLGSLPLALKTQLSTVPAPIPYLSAPQGKIAAWRPKLEALPGLRVALAWAGHARHANDRNRSMALATLEPLLKTEGVFFVSVQRDLHPGDAEILVRNKITHVGDALTDMTDTAAVLALCDLTIAVDTAVAHLAGALGRPLWIMLPFAPDWRWAPGGPNAWYPQARLFRQPAPGDWASVIAQIRDALKTFGKA